MLPTSKRQETQIRREQHAVEWCADWHSRRTGTQFDVLPRLSPSAPPDGLIESKRKKRWIEVVSATLDESWDRYSHEVGDGLSIGLPAEISVNPDKIFARKFVERVAAKLRKPSYKPLHDQYGPGLLVVSVFYPLFNDYTLRQIKNEVHSDRVFFENSFFSDGLVLVNPYHTDIRLGLRTIVPRND